MRTQQPRRLNTNPAATPLEYKPSSYAAWRGQQSSRLNPRWCPEKYADRDVGKQELKRQRADALFCVGENTINTLFPPLPRAEYKENGIKHNGKQNYLCRDCYRQFVGDHNLTYPGCHSGIDRTILKMLVRNCGIRDISEITGCSRYKVQKVLKISQHHVLPKKNHYDALEVDELWTFVGNKKNKVWLIVESLIKSNESKEPKQQGIHISQPPLFPQPFVPCPRLLYRVV